MKFPIFNLIFTVFLFWLTIQINSYYEEYLSYFFILTIGIIHGSNDISLIKVVNENKKAFSNYILLYVGLIIFNIIAFIVFPTIALIVFIFISCYHFGEQHFHNQIKKQNLVTRLLFLSYGMLIFSMLFYFNSQNTSLIINELIGYSLIEVQFLWFLIVSITLSTVFFIFNRNNFRSSLSYPQELFLVLLFAILFKLAALLWAFAIYFIVWHSLPSLTDQIKALYGESNRIHIIQYVKSSFVYWIISLFGLAILYYATSYYNINFVAIFFAFLAAITIPHVVVMYFLNKN